MSSGSSSVYSWGSGDHGQLGQVSIAKEGLTNSYEETAPRLMPGLEGQDVGSVSCGFKHTAAVTEDGRVLTLGKCEDGLLGHDGGDGSHCLQPHMVSEGLEGVKAASVSCGESHTAVLSTDGDLFTWGFGGSFFSGAGALGLGGSGNQARPQRVLVGGSEEVKLSKIASGKSHMMGLGMDGEVWTWGRGENGRLGTGSNDDALEPFPVEYFLDQDISIVDIACGNSFCLALTSEGQIYGWGKNDQSQLGIGGSMSMDVYNMEYLPTHVDSLTDKVVAIGAGGSHSLAINEQGQVYMWGMRLWTEPHKMTALADHRIVQVDGGDGYSMALSDAGQVFTWARGMRTARNGVLGHGNKSREAQPKLVEALADTPCRQVAAGSNFALAVSGLPALKR